MKFLVDFFILVGFFDFYRLEIVLSRFNSFLPQLLLIYPLSMSKFICSLSPKIILLGSLNSLLLIELHFMNSGTSIDFSYNNIRYFRYLTLLVYISRMIRVSWFWASHFIDNTSKLLILVRLFLLILGFMKHIAHNFFLWFVSFSRKFLVSCILSSFTKLIYKLQRVVYTQFLFKNTKRWSYLKAILGAIYRWLRPFL